MSRLARTMFPYLEGVWGRVNLNDLALQHRDEPQHERLVELAHRTLGVDYSYGGYLEDRAFLMRNHYQRPGFTQHLGVDYNAPVHRWVSLPLEGRLLYSTMDPDQDGGWGGKLIFDTDQGIVLFGHLDNIANAIGRIYPAGYAIGRVAAQDINGGWYPHLHVQRCAVFSPEVDGYSCQYSGIEEDFPDPEALMEGT